MVDLSLTRFRGLLKGMLEGESLRLVAKGVDDFPILADDPLTEAHLQLDALLAVSKRHQDWYDANVSATLKGYPEGQAILDADPAQQILLVKAALQRTVFNRGKPRQYRQRQYDGVCQAVFCALLKRRLPYSASDLSDIAQLYAKHAAELWGFPLGQYLKWAAPLLEQDNGELRTALTEIQASDYPEPRHRQRLREVLGAGADVATPDPGLVPGDPWGETVIQELATLAHGPVWAALLQAAGATEGKSKASQAWLKTVQSTIDTVGETAYRTVLERWLTAAAALSPTDGFDDLRGCYSAWLVKTPNETRLRALVWSVPLVATPTLHQQLVAIAERSFTKVPGIGPVAIRLGNGCLHTLAALGLEGVASLTALRERIKHASSRKLLESLIDRVAAERGIDRGTVEDLAVPDHGLVDGERSTTLGEAHTTLRLLSSGKTELRWQVGDKVQKSVPASVRRDHPDNLKALQKTAKAMQATWSAQRRRLENFYLNQRQFTVDHWRRYFAGHGLMQTLAQRLIWHINGTPYLWWDAAWRTLDGQPLGEPDLAALVSLWHPIDADAETIRRWRELIQHQEIRQPFKQAFREVYRLTDAERETGNYSNRFAAHLIKQHLFNALRQGRNWRFSLIGAWDGSENTPSVELPDWQLRAEFWVEGADWRRTADSGVLLYLSTDQVRFYEQGEMAPLPLDQVPALPFSEVMRDVDLFIGVGSVGNDPTWEDHGDQPHWGNYWGHYAFGELSATAQTRREVLADLLPKLKIGPRCELAGRFLWVKGSFRTYKIHLGSSNILMEPNDQYLCIVPDQTRRLGDKLFLPFDDDVTLALILSKAFLLADDDKISDATIVSQIRRG